MTFYDKLKLNLKIFCKLGPSSQNLVKARLGWIYILKSGLGQVQIRTLASVF